MKILWYSVIISVVGWGSYGAYEGYNITNNTTTNIVNSDEISTSIAGEVNKPGNYKMGNDLVVYDLIMKAGGLTIKADISSINFEQKLQNGIQIFINVKDDLIQKINLNTATEEEINGAPDISKTVAANIISYRNANGNFTNWDIILNIKGIGEKTLEKLQNYFYI